MWTSGIVFALAVAFVVGDEAAQDQAFIKKLSDGDFQFGNPPDGLTEVKTWIYVPGVMIYPDKPIFATEMYFGMKWNDTRLESEGEHTLPDHLRNNIWRPDLFFKESVKVDMTEYPSFSRYTKVKSNGEVKFSMRVFSKSICRDLVSKKNDITCSLTLEMYGQNANRVSIVGPKLYNPDFESIFTPGWKMTDADVSDCQKTYPTGTFSCKKITFKMSKLKKDNDSGSNSEGDD